MYLKDQVKGMIATSIGMMVLWSYGTIGYFSYMKTNDMDVINMMPMFQILNGWFGVFMFFFLGVWSRRFRLGVNNKAEEERKKRESGKAYEIEESPRTAETSPMTSRPSSPKGSIHSGTGDGDGAPLSRPGSGASQATGSRPASGASQPTGSRPGSGTSQPAGSRPGSGASQPAGSRPGSGTSQVAGSRPASRPPSADPIPEEPEETPVEPVDAE